MSKESRQHERLRVTLAAKALLMLRELDIHFVTAYDIMNSTQQAIDYLEDRAQELR
jgi:hypothetical protein